MLCFSSVSCSWRTTEDKFNIFLHSKQPSAFNYCAKVVQVTTHVSKNLLLKFAEQKVGCHQTIAKTQVDKIDERKSSKALKVCLQRNLHGQNQSKLSLFFLFGNFSTNVCTMLNILRYVHYLLHQIESSNPSPTHKKDSK